MQAIQNRRTLHQPFFPLPSPPPTSPPPSFPKYPFTTDPQQPFFPNYPSPPPPPSSSPSGGAATSVPTIPANISSLIYPHSSPSHHPTHSRLLPAILFSLIALSLLALSAAFLLHRRRRRHDPPIPEPNKLPSAPLTVPPPPPPPATSARPPSSEFLCVGTLVNSRTSSGNQAPPPASAAGNGKDTDVVPVKPGSPELRPLPPLARSVRNNYGNATAGATDSDEEFYSPRGSDSRSRSSSRRKFEAVETAVDGKCGSRNSDLSTPSYPDSNSDGSSSPIGSSPVKSKDSRSGTPPPPPPPPPPRSMRPLTPSPPKRKPPSPSPPSSPVVKSSRVSLRSPAKFKESDGNLRKFELLEQNSRNQPSAPTPAVPPPPPPPPPVGYWESRVRKPPAVATPKSVTLKRPAVEFVENSDSMENLDSMEKNEETMPRPKLKPLHWDKVRASSDRVMVWDQLKSSSFQVNEEMIETLFGCNMANAAQNEAKKPHPVLPSPRTENRVLDPKKSQNIAILLRALNVTKEEVCEALSEGNAESLGTELLETLLKMAPTKEEERKLKEHSDDSPSKLGPAEKFLKAVLDIPFAFMRVEAMLYIANFDSEVSYLKNSFETLEAACEELRNSRLFLKLLEAVLKTGNRMNVGTNRGDAHAFKLDTLLKLVDVKGTDGKTTLLHFVVQEIIRAEGSRLSCAKTQANALQNDLECKKRGLQVVAGLGGELANVKKAAAMDSDVLGSYVSKLASGIGKIGDVLRLNEASNTNNNNNNSSSRQFQEAVGAFSKKAEDQIIKVQAQESVALSLVKEITEYFHGNSAKEEAHPFRIFMVVRDFLSILDQVCKEVGKINERSIASSARQFPVPVNPTLPPLFPKIQALRPETSDDESSSSSL